MSTSIDLEYPFSEEYDRGYIVVNSEGRRNVILYNSERDRTTISYARYLVSVEKGKKLSDDVVVHHINGNKLDDRLDNYEILENSEHISMHSSSIGKITIDIICPKCNNVFSRRKGRTFLQQQSKVSFCSRECLYEYISENGHDSITSELGYNSLIREYRLYPDGTEDLIINYSAME